jgi:sirohydrochlorin ferrochelatase
MSYPMIEQATGVHNVTAMRWCDEKVSTSANEEVENPVKILSADGKERPSERLSPVDLAERRRRVRELRNAGYTLEEIAEELGVSLGTAELYPGRGVKNLASICPNRPDPPAAQNFDFRGPPIFSVEKLLLSAVFLAMQTYLWKSETQNLSTSQHKTIQSYANQQLGIYDHVPPCSVQYYTTRKSTFL